MPKLPPPAQNFAGYADHAHVAANIECIEDLSDAPTTDDEAFIQKIAATDPEVLSACASEALDEAEGSTTEAALNAMTAEDGDAATDTQDLRDSYILDSGASLHI
jgi:hypothetical protein